MYSYGRVSGKISFLTISLHLQLIPQPRAYGDRVGSEGSEALRSVFTGSRPYITQQSI